jgi:hypothetical protein
MTLLISLIIQFYWIFLLNLENFKRFWKNKEKKLYQEKHFFNLNVIYNWLIRTELPYLIFKNHGTYFSKIILFVFKMWSQQSDKR